MVAQTTVDRSAAMARRAMESGPECDMRGVHIAARRRSAWAMLS